MLKTHEYIHKYNSLGYVPLPLERGTKEPKAKGWPSRTRKDFNPEDFVGECNIGIVLGENSGGLVDIDLDCPEAIKAATLLLPPTGMVFGRDSKPKSHYLYMTDTPTASRRYEAGSKTLAEYRGKGVQTVFPPSLHPSGELIRFDEEGLPGKVKNQDLQQAVTKVAAAALIAQHWREGIRHNATLDLAAVLLKQGWTPDEVGTFVEAIMLAAGDEELSDRISCIETTAARITAGEAVTAIPSLAQKFGNEVVDKVMLWLGISLKTEKKPNPAPAGAVADKTALEEVHTSMGFTDAANAERFVKACGHHAKYLPRDKCWQVFDGKRWKADDDGAVYRAAKETLSVYVKQGVVSSDVLKWGATSLSARGINSMVALSAHQSYIPTEALDKNPWLFNCENGTVNLKTGSLQPHNPEDFITKLAPIAFDANADCLRWKQFLREIMDGKQDVIDFIQCAVGYCLTAVTREQVMFILHGAGANGKSTFVNTIQAMLGDYAMETPVSTLMVQKSTAIPNDVARLAGARFVAASESEHGEKLAEAKIKQLTGGDRVSARFMHGEWFEFIPAFKLWMSTNNLPEIKGTDEGIWRRIRYIPFNVTFPENKRDVTLGDMLKQELPGILNWAIAGCVKWQKDGLKAPAAVINATNAYRSEMDTIAQFIDECCTVDSTKNEAIGYLYTEYESWCKSNQELALSKPKFGRELDKRGFKKEKKGGSWHREGLALQCPDVDGDCIPF